MGKLRQAGEYDRCGYCRQVILGRRECEKHEEKCRRTGYPLARPKQRPRWAREWKPRKRRH